MVHDKSAGCSGDPDCDCPHLSPVQCQLCLHCLYNCRRLTLLLEASVPQPINYEEAQRLGEMVMPAW